MTPVYDFMWKGESASGNYGVDTLAIGSTVIAERRDKTSVVPGRSGLVHDQDGAVEDVEIRLTIQLPYTQGRSVAPVQEIRRWLKGYGQLALSTVPGRYMMAYITDQIALDPIVEGFTDRKGTVIFRCDPYLYHTDAQPVVLSEATVLNNPGDTAAEPVITVNAIGDVDLMIGTQTILLTDLTGSIIIDSTAREAYREEETPGMLVNWNSHMSGDFPILSPGSNAISWSLGEGATLTSVVISPKWRDEM